LKSDAAILAVNIFALLVFIGILIYAVVKISHRLKPELIEASFTRKIKTSSAYQNVFAFTTVVLASTLFELFTDGKYRMIWIIFIISIVTIFFQFIYEKVANTNRSIDEYRQYDEHLKLIEQIMQCKGYHLILKALELEKIEETAEEVYVFTEDLTTDIPAEEIRVLDSTLENIGLFASIVASNIPKGKKYTYFLKDDLNNREYIKDYFTYHMRDEQNLKYAKNIQFYLVKPSEFTFFTELYLYKDDVRKDMAFEWLPALGEINDANKQFYLELSSQQVQNINEIIIELKTTSCTYDYTAYTKDKR